MALGNKHLCFILNTVILVCGISLIIHGWIAKNEKNQIYDNSEDSKFFELITNEWLSGTMYICLGTIVMFFAALGIYAAFVQDRIILKYHSVLVLVIVLSLFGWIVVFSWWPVSSADSLKSDYNKALQKFNEESSFKDGIQTFAKKHFCCSATSETFEEYKKNYPKSCCVKDSQDSCSEVSPGANAITCASQYANLFNEKLSSIKDTYFWMSMFQFIAVVAAIGLFWITKNTSDDGFGV